MNMRKMMAAAVFAAMIALLLSSGAWAEGGYTTHRDMDEALAKMGQKGQAQQLAVSKAPAPAKNPGPVPKSQGVSPLVDRVRDAYSVKRPASSAVTIAVGQMPTELPKFSKGVVWGVVAFDPQTKKVVRGKVIPAGEDNRAGQIPALVIFEDQVSPDSVLLGADRWYNNRLGGRRGEILVFNMTGGYKVLRAGMYLDRDPQYLARMASAYGTRLSELRYSTATLAEAEAVIRQLGAKKLKTPDGVRYTPVDLQVFRKLYVQPALVYGWQRFFHAGGLAICIPPEPISAGVNLGTALLVAIFDRRHNIPCLSTLGGGLERFQQDQRFYEGGGALLARDMEKLKKARAEAKKGAASLEELLAQVFPASPTGYPQVYDRPGFWLEPKRVEWPSGGGMFRSPQLRSKYSFSNTYFHLFGGEIAPNATLHWGPAGKIDHWWYRASSGYRGRGHYYGVGASAELVARHKWGGSDTRFAFWYGYDQLDKGRFHHERRHPWMFEWQTELWWRGIKLGQDGRYGELFSGVKMGTLAKTDDFFLAWVFPVLYRSPYDIFKLSGGPQFLHFFSRTGNEPRGGGLGVQPELLDGIGYRFSYFFGQKFYHTGWIDPYRVWFKIQELRAQLGIKEIPWDPPK